jgi:hypothetical protein
LGVSSPISDPLTIIFPGLVESEGTGLSTSFGELIGFFDKFCGEDPRGELVVWGYGVSGSVPGDLGDFRRGINKVRKGSESEWCHSLDILALLALFDEY